MSHIAQTLYVWQVRAASAQEGPREERRGESIINADRKVATCKLALVRALCDIAMTSWAVAKWEPGGGAVSVPLGAVSEKRQQYYWPLLDGEQLIPQINAEAEGGRPIAFRGKRARSVGRNAWRAAGRCRRPYVSLSLKVEIKLYAQTAFSTIVPVPLIPVAPQLGMFFQPPGLSMMRLPFTVIF